VLRVVGQQPSAIYQNVALNLPSVGTLRVVGKQPTCAVTLNLFATPSSGTLRLVGKDSILALGKTFPLTGVLRLEGNRSTTEVQIGD
jgi:hypothetical protein